MSIKPVVYDITSGDNSIQLSSGSPKLCDPFRCKPLEVWKLWLDTLPSSSATTKLTHRFSSIRCALIQGLISTCRSLSEAVWRMTTQGIMPSCSWSDKASPNQNDNLTCWHWLCCFSGCLCTESLADLPRHFIVKADDRFRALESHEMDVVCLVKRNAADDVLAQDPWNQWPNSHTIFQSVEYFGTSWAIK